VARVLIIAWEGQDRDEVVEVFDEAGHDVESVEPKDEAVAKAKTSLPDIICLDLGDSPGHAREVSRVLSKTKATRDIPLVLYGVDAQTEPRARTAAPRGTLIPHRSGKALMVAVKQALNHRVGDGDGEEAPVQAARPVAAPAKPASRGRT
jgi:DNA-binding NarL/FixJ family response regulator